MAESVPNVPLSQGITALERVRLGIVLLFLLSANRSMTPRSTWLLFSLSKPACQKKEEFIMGILESARPAIVICTRDRTRATEFYRDMLGLTLAYEDNLAAVFQVGGATLRLAFVADFAPHDHTILGFCVADVEAAVRALREKGITFNTYAGFNQNELGILTLPGGGVRVAWFKDPDGNVLSVTNA